MTKTKPNNKTQNSKTFDEKIREKISKNQKSVNMYRKMDN